MIKVGMIGYGTIGKSISSLIESGQAGEIQLSSILVRNADKIKNAAHYPWSITANAEEFFKQDSDIIIEAAGHNAVESYGEEVLSSGSHLMILSVGALANHDLYEKLIQSATAYKKQLIIPSAAIAGLDRIAAGALGEINEITLITKKPVKSWYGTLAEEMIDLEIIQEPTCIFEGNARTAAKLFPENVNVSATLSLAGIGFGKTKVQIFIDPTIELNTHSIVAEGAFGRVEISVQNSPFTQNPKSSPIVAMSVAKVLKNMSTAVVIGV